MVFLATVCSHPLRVFFSSTVPLVIDQCYSLGSPSYSLRVLYSAKVLLVIDHCHPLSHMFYLIINITVLHGTLCVSSGFFFYGDNKN